jgi:hypothetical protein
MEGLTLVVLAAGIGSRYGGIKQLEPVGPSGEIIIDYSVFDALGAGFEKFVFVLRQEIEEIFREKIGSVIERHCETKYVIQSLHDLPVGFSVPEGRVKPWGTGHAVLVCRDVLGEVPFAVINADDYYGRSSFQSLASHLSKASDGGDHYEYCMVGFRIENTLTAHGHVSRGVCQTTLDGTLVQIDERLRVEKTATGARFQDADTWIDIHPGTVVSMNMWGFTPSFLQELDVRFPRFLQADHTDINRAEFLLPTIVGDLVKEGRARVTVLPTSEQWYGVTYREDRISVQAAIGKLVSTGVYPADLWAAS